MLTINLLAQRDKKEVRATYRQRKNLNNITRFYKDGTFLVLQNERYTKGTYMISGRNELFLRFASGAAVKGRIENSVMYDNQGEAWILSE